MSFLRFIVSHNNCFRLSLIFRLYYVSRGNVATSDSMQMASLMIILNIVII